MYGIPNMKLDKKNVVDRRIQLLREEGIDFFVNADIGDGKNGTIAVSDIIAKSDALLLTTGATIPRD